MNFIFNVRSMFSLFYILASMGMLTIILVSPEINDGQQSLIVGWLVLYAITITLIIGLKPTVTRKQVLVLLIPCYYLASSVWSQNSITTAQYSVSLGMNFLAALLIAKCCDEDQFPFFIGRVILFACVLGYALYYFGYEGASYDDAHSRLTLIGTEPIRGIFNHKITAGIASALGIVIYYAFFKGAERIIAIAFLAYFLLHTGSSLALSILLICVPLQVVVINLLRLRSSEIYLLSFMILTPIIGSIIFISFGGEVLDALGRDGTLTGRTILWQWGLDVFEEKPFFGWGYYGYHGSDIALTDARSFREFYTYSVPHFHNTYIQALVDGGIISILMLMWMFYCSLKHYSRRSKIDRRWVGMLILINAIFISNIFMNQLFQYNNFITLLFFVVVIYSMEQREGTVRKKEQR